MSEIPGQFLIAAGVVGLFLLAMAAGVIGSFLLGREMVREAEEYYEY